MVTEGEEEMGSSKAVKFGKRDAMVAGDIVTWCFLSFFLSFFPSRFLSVLLCFCLFGCDVNELCGVISSSPRYVISLDKPATLLDEISCNLPGNQSSEGHFKSRPFTVG